MITIKDIKGREILDSRGNPTVEVEVELVEETSWSCARAPRRSSSIRSRPAPWQ